MAESTVPPVTDAAIDAALQWARTAPAVARRDHFRMLLEAAAPHMVPPPELPTEAGQLVISAPGKLLAEVPLRLGRDGYWHTLDGSTSYMGSDVEGNGWTLARVVPDDEHGPVAVLRQVAERLTSRPSIKDVDDLIAEAQIVIGVCLERLDGNS